MQTTSRIFWISPFAALLPAVALAAVLKVLPLRVEVTAGQYDRHHVPLRALISVPHDWAAVKEVLLVRSDGSAAAGQLTTPGLLEPEQQSAEGSVLRELHLILAELAAGKTLVFDEIRAPADNLSHGQMFAWHETPGASSELRAGDRPVLKYMYEPLDELTPERREATSKVYHHVYSPDGTRLVTKGLGGLYPHHRGLFYGFNRIRYGDGKQADTWHCGHGESQQHAGLVASEAGRVLGRHQVRIDWHGQDRKVFAREVREMTAYSVPGGTLIEFASRLQSAGGKVKLDGDPQHAGFQFRASQEVPDKTAALTYYLRPDGKDQPGSFRNWPDDPRQENLPWHVMSIVLGEKRYTVAYLDKPTNPKPARYSERDYGRFGSYFEYELDDEHALDVNYRVWLVEGEMTLEDATKLNRDFSEPPLVTIDPAPAR